MNFIQKAGAITSFYGTFAIFLVRSHFREVKKFTVRVRPGRGRDAEVINGH